MKKEEIIKIPKNQLSQDMGQLKSNFPKGWEVKKLKDVCTVFSDGDWIESKNQSTEGIRLIQTGNIGFGFFKNKKDKTKYISEKTFNILNCTEVFPNDLLVSRLPDPVGKSCIIPNIDSKMITAVDCTIIRTNKSTLPVFLLYYQMSDKYLKEVNSLITGTTRSRISRKNLGLIQIPLPPLPEQKRIVAILDKAFSAIEQAKANTEQNLQNAKEVFESYLQAVFENRGEDWEEKKLGEVAKTNGRIGWKGLTAKEYTQEGPLFLSVHSLNYGDYVDFTKAFHISQNRYDESPEIMLKKNDILICKDGAGIGKLGIIPELIDATTINSSLLLIRCKKDVLSKYLYYNLLSPIFQSIVQSRLSGATTPHLYQRDIVTFPILLPNLSIQQQIVQKLDSLSLETKKLESIYQQKLVDLEELKKSLLQKAFNGELS